MRRIARMGLLVCLSLGACAEAVPPVAPAAPLASATSSAAPAAPPSSAPAPPAAPPPYGDAAQLGGWIDTYVSAFGSRWGEAAAVQGYVAVAVDGKMIFHKAYGKANREKGVAADDDTRFRIGSLTKQFTATAILQLAKKGLLKVEDPIRKYLPDYPAATGDKVTIHHLLTHTSGIPSYTGDEELMKRRDKPIGRAELLATFQSKPLDFEPGARFSYSNSGYFVLGVIIEKVTGKSYEDYLQENIFRPAGMTRTSTIDAPDAPDTAMGYTVDDLDEIKPSKPIDMSFPFSAGAIRSTARDLVAWDSALRGEKIIDAASQARMYTPEKDGYAYGWMISQTEGKKVIAHGGGIDGFVAYIARVPEEKLVVVTLVNNDEFSIRQLANAVVQMALSGKPTPPKTERGSVALDAALMGSWVGDYSLSESSRKELEAKLPAGVMKSISTVTMTAEAGKLFFKPVGQSRIQVFRAEDGALFTKRSDIAITGEPGSRPGAPMKGLALKQSGLEMRYERAKAEAKKPTAVAKKLPAAKR